MGAAGRPASEAIGELIAGLDQPVTLRAVGIERGSLDELARRALDYHPVKANPRPISTAADVMEILELAW
jgi:alcohol dehydrogenase class IV